MIDVEGYLTYVMYHCIFSKNMYSELKVDLMKQALLCTKCGSRNYTITISEKHKSERFEAKKHCKVCNEHTLHKASI
ncbi:50S ribosomal protein L33 [Abyssicoccus albus]